MMKTAKLKELSELQKRVDEARAALQTFKLQFGTKKPAGLALAEYWSDMAESGWRRTPIPDEAWPAIRRAMVGAYKKKIANEEQRARAAGLETKDK